MVSTKVGEPLRIYKQSYFLFGRDRQVRPNANSNAIQRHPTPSNAIQRHPTLINGNGPTGWSNANGLPPSNASQHYPTLVSAQLSPPAQRHQGQLNANRTEPTNAKHQQSPQAADISNSS